MAGGFPSRVGGLLCVNDDVLHIHFAAPNGFRHWNNPVLEGNPEYQLGWADALQALDLPRIVWVGNWILRPDNSLLSLSECEAWLRRGAARGIFDDNTILLVAGVQTGRIELQALSLLENQLTEIHVNNYSPPPLP